MQRADGIKRPSKDRMFEMCLAGRTYGRTNIISVGLKMEEVLRLLTEYEDYLIGTKGRSKNTLRVYMDDLRSFVQFLRNEKFDFRDSGDKGLG